MTSAMAGGGPITAVMDTQNDHIEGTRSTTGRPHAKSLNNAQDTKPKFPPPKTDKPRPHICATCTRSFARLEHLKRHERSHTKEKPFTCNDCTRAFARRDLLLRHQQKLHMTAPPVSRGKGARRESTSSTVPSGSAKVRKNSMASNNSGNTGPGQMRPRANTISHVDNAARGLMAATNSSISSHQSFAVLGHAGMQALPGVGGYHFRGMSTATGHHGNPHVLPKLETRNRNVDVSASLRTAPTYGGFGGDMDMDNMWCNPGSTVNPAQLHFPDPITNFDFESSQNLYHQGLASYPLGQSGLERASNLGWMNTFDHQMPFNNPNEQAIDESSPSANSTGSPEEMSDTMLDASNMASNDASIWTDSMMSPPGLISAYAQDFSTTPFPEPFPHIQLSPKSLNASINNTDQYFSEPPPMDSATPLPMFPGMNHRYFHPSKAANANTPSNSTASIGSSNRQSSVTSVSTDTITDATRQALLASLTQPSMYGHGLKTAQPQTFSPLSPAYPGRSRSMSSVPLPSTYDLQRYVTAYIQYFHPHLPFLHIPTLSFDSPAFVTQLGPGSDQHALDQSEVTGGGGSLILAMAAIGALYEYDFGPSRELFDMAKTMIQLYLQERRKADMSATFNVGQKPNETATQNTPLWLVQAMLLNVIYGHNCGDKMAANIASTHCAALVSLARGADLVKPSSDNSHKQDSFQNIKSEDSQMAADGINRGYIYEASYLTREETESNWYSWKIDEERKRTLYAVFILSSLLVSSYNHAPALMNSEIRLDLPCDENLWAADSALAWQSLGGSTFADQKAILFSTALSSLLMASQWQQQRQQQMLGLGFETVAEDEIRPSTFGCLVLINALHNYIWETRQQHMARQWTTQETEAMHAHIEPALRAWQAAWSSNPEHSLERPNPFGASSLSADCIPLLDLAHVRLFVNLGKSKEAFFERDFDAMASELARGAEIVQHAEHSPKPDDHGGNVIPENESVDVSMERDTQEQMADSNHCLEQCSKRERHLRKAAACAANALTMADRLNVTFADYTSRELPLQSALCSFDCAQVLAEWLSTVQQRVGRYLGILGRDYSDFSQPSGCVFLEDEDCGLLEKVRDILHNFSTKLAGNASVEDTVIGDESYYASKILLVHAQMYERQSVWPVTREMSESLRTQAAHIQATAEASLATSS